MKINPYIHFNGNCREAFEFYRRVFGGEFQSLLTFREMPPEFAVDASLHHRIMHVTLPISKETTLMGSDTNDDSSFRTGNNFSISINADNEEECRKLFDLLSEDGMVVMPLAPYFWGSLFGMCKDQFGISWMLSSELTGNH